MRKIKEFFRLTRGKVILWILLFIIFPWKYRGGCPQVIGIKCPQWEFFGGFTYLIKLIDSGVLELLLSIILMLIFSYLISCLTIFIYDKIKNRRKRV